MKNKLYQIRTFSEKFNFVFEWVGHNWKPLLKYITYCVLPVSLLQGFGAKGLMGQLMLAGAVSDEAFAAQSMTLVLQVLLYYGCMVVGFVLLHAVTFSLLHLSMVEHRDLNTVSWAHLRPLLPRMARRGLLVMVVLGVLLALVCLLMGGLAVLSPISLFLTIPALVAVSVALVPVMPAYMLGQQPVFSAVRQGLHLGFGTWWGCFSVMFVMSLLTSVLQSFVSVPMYICVFLESITMGNLSGGGAQAVDFATYLSGVLASYGTYLAYVLTVMMTAVQYGHAAQKLDGHDNDREIADFDKC